MTIKSERSTSVADLQEQFRNPDARLAMLAAIVESSDDAIISKNLDGIITSWNRGAEGVFGYTADEAVGQSVTMLMPPERVDEEPDILSRVRRGEKVDHYQTIRRRKDGRLIDISLTVSPITNSDGEIIGASKIARDITLQKRAEEAIRESEEKFYTLAESVPQMVWMADPDGSRFWFNRTWYDYTGTTFDEVKGWGWERVPHPDYMPSIRQRWERCIATREPFDMEYPIRGRNGEYRWFLTRVKPAFGDDGDIVRWFGTNTDIDDELRLARRNRFVLELDETVRPLENPEEIALSLATMLGRHLDVDRCAYGEVEPDQDHFHITGDYTRDDRTISLVGHYAMAQFGAEPLRLMRANETYVVNDVSTDPRITHEDRVSYLSAQIGAVIAVPLHKNGRFVSCMAVHQRVPRHWKNEEITLVTYVANRFWESIERARLVKSLHHALLREKEARSIAEESSRVKDEFLATVSHELRTPLNAVLGWASLLRSGKLTPDATERAFETLYNSARSQAQLIDDLLDVSRIITGKLRLDVQTVELSRLIDSTVDSLRPGAEAKNVRLQVITDPHAGPVSGDASRLQQVIWNLISNAVKFTPKGGRVYVKLEQVNSHVEVTVTDTGIGIDAGFLPQVFDRFSQAEAPASHGRSGLGLGLSIVKQLVELHGGTVAAESGGDGRGSTFTVRLPRIPVLPVAQEKERRVHPRISEYISIDAAPQLDSLRVLVVDDEPDARNLIHEVLELCGAEVQTSSSAAEAFETLLLNRFDVLVSDIGMPEEDGYSLIEKVRSLPADKGGSIPSVALTAYARVEDRVRALRAGFQAHLPKPIEPVELAAVVASLAARSSRPTEIS